MQDIITISTDAKEKLYDITEDVKKIVSDSGVKEGIVSIYVKHATAAIMIQENWDDSVQKDVITLLKELAPQGKWEHDSQDGNGDAHLKSGLVGPGENIPVRDGRILLGQWQNIFLCEFDGPRKDRKIVVTVMRC